MARNNEAKIEYHYVQQSKNRDTVRTQGRAINSSLKKLKRISSSKLEAVPSAPRDDEPTAQYITIPHDDRIDLRLKEAIEEVQKGLYPEFSEAGIS